MRTLESLLTKRETEAQRLLIANESQAAEMQKLTSLLRTIDDELKTVNTELTRAATEKTELAAQLRAAKSQLAATTSHLSVGDANQVSRLQSDLQLKSEAMAKAMSRNKEITFMLAWLERKYDVQSQELKTKSDHLTQSRTEIERLRAELAQLRVLASTKEGAQRR